MTRLIKGHRIKSKQDVILLRDIAKRTRAQKPSNKKRFFIYALGLLVLGGGSFVLYSKWKARKNQNQSLPDADTETIVINNNLPSYSSSSAASSSKVAPRGNDNFPLKSGSKGNRVTLLQQALAKIIGKEAMDSNGGVDGKFGKGTAKALRAAGYPEIVDEKTYNIILNSVNSELQVIFNPQAIALSIYRAAQLKNAQGVIDALQQINNPTEYSTINEVYKRQGFISKTIVTDLLDFAFKTNDDAKALIRNEFLRIGLKVDDVGKWTLQGFKLFKDLITLRKTVVTDKMKNKIPVKRNTILGDEVKIENGLTWFRTVDNSILSVPTQDVKYS